MKLSHPLILNMLLLTVPNVFAQSLPDEINFPHYEKIKNEDAKVRNNDESIYTETVSVRMRTEQSIRSSETQIQEQQTSLAQAQNELSQRTQDQNELDKNIDRTNDQLKRETTEYNRELSIWQSYDRDYQQLLRTSQPLEARYESQKARLAQQEQLQRRLELEVAQSSSELEQLERKLGSLPNDISKSRQEVSKLKSKISSLSQEATSLKSRVTEIERTISTDDSKLTNLKHELTELNKEISMLTRQIENARQNGTDPAEIKRLESELAAKTSSRESVNTQKRELENKLEPQKSELTKIEAELNVTQSRLDESQRSLVSEEKSLDRMIAEETQIAGNIQRVRQELARSTATLRQSEQNLNQFRREFSSTEREWRDTVDLLNSRKIVLDQQIQRVDSVQRRKESLEVELAQLIQRSNQNISAMNSLNSQIQNNQQSISRLVSDLSTLNVNLVRLKREETDSLDRWQKSAARFNISNAAYEKRLTLFEQHEDAAIALGRSEASNLGVSLGDKEGLKVGAQTASQVAQELGADLGSVQGKLWANIRAEGQGYSIGYTNGRKAPIDNEKAKLEGGQKGEASAQQYLEQVLRPKYFVQYLDELIEKSEVLSASESKVAGLATPVKNSIMESNIEKNLKAQINQDPEALTTAEIALAKNIKTKLDSLIAEGSVESSTLEAKAIQLADPAQVYTTPSSIPYGKTKCSPVYKELQVFKAACIEAYKTDFKSDYTQAHANAFAEVYIVDYKKHLAQKQVLNRAQAYSATFATSYKLAESEGFKIGTDETFQEEVKEHFDLAYAETLKSGDVALRAKINQEVKEHVKVNATLGLVSANLSQTIFMPGSIGKIEVLLKNISPKAFSGAVAMKFTKLENVQVASNSSVLQSLAAESKGLIPAIDYKISPNAKAGSTLVIEGVVDLPGDKYRSIRSVKFQIKKVLGKNVVPELGFKYDGSPKIRNLFGVNKHPVRITLSPKHEAATQGYKVVLTPTADSVSMIEFTQQAAQTKALTVGEKIEVKLGYKLKNSAKGKVVTMTCDIFSEGMLIEQKLIKLNAK